jgi:hypothetical protein
MRRRRLLIVGVGLLVCALAGGAVVSAQGSSTPPKLRLWGLAPGTLSTTSPRIAHPKGTKTVVVIAKQFTATQIDNAPSGTSQGDEIIAAGKLFQGSKGAGSIQAQDVLTSVTPRRLMITFTALLAGGQITAAAVAHFNNAPVAAKAAILGGTGIYGKIRGVVYLTSTGSATKLAFVYTTS